MFVINNNANNQGTLNLRFFKYQFNINSISTEILELELFYTKSL